MFLFRSHPLNLVFLFMACVAVPRLVAEDAGPTEMTTRVFKLSSNISGLNFPDVSEKKAAEQAADPFAPGAANNSPLEQEPHVPVFKSSRQILEASGVTFPSGASAVFDPVTRELTVHNTPAMLELTQAFIDTIVGHGTPATLGFTLTVVEGPGEIIRQVNAAASRTADATPQLDELLDAAARPGSGVKVAGETFLEMTSGTRATVAAVRERPQVIGFKKQTVPITTSTSAPAPSVADKGDEAELSWVREDGLKLELELEGTLGVDGETLEVAFSFELGPEDAAVVDGEGSATMAASAPPAEGLRKARFATAISSASGSTRLMSITKPTGAASGPKTGGQQAENNEDNGDVLWAVFLTGRVCRAVPSPGVKATPGVPQGKLATGMHAVAFHVPEGLVESLIPAPYAPTQPRLSLEGWLETRGVTLPRGSSAEHRNGLLQVVNTPENIEIIAALVEHAWAQAPKTVAFTAHTFAAPAALLRQLHRQSAAAKDDTAMLAAMEAAVTRGQATPVSSAFFEGKSGVRSVHECASHHSFLARFGTTDINAQPQLAFRQRPSGSRLEIEPMVGADGQMLEVTYMHELQLAQPAGRRWRQHFRNNASQKDYDLPVTDFHVLRTGSRTAFSSGGTKLISLHCPTFDGRMDASAGQGGPALLWATFLQAHVVPQVSKPPPRPLTPEQAAIVRLTEKMNKIIFPTVTFKEATLEQAIKFLTAKSRELDTTTQDVREKGVPIIIRPDDFPSGSPITLDLTDVPMSEALRYVTELSQKTYRVEAHAVMVQHSHYGVGLLHTRSFRVPEFLSLGAADAADAAGTAAVADPFATPLPDVAKAGPPMARKTARQILEYQGITFPEGSSARYIAATSTLVVRNTRPNLDLVEAAVGCWSCRPWANTTVAITAQVLQGPGPLLRRIAAQAAPRSDHRALLEELLAAVKAGTVQALDTARIETKSGVRASTEQGRDRTVVTGITLAGENHPAVLHHKALPIGFCLEMEPTLGADGSLNDLTLAAEYHTAPPARRPEHLIDAQGRRLDFELTDTHRSQVVTALTVPDGRARLLHLWKPIGTPGLEKADVLQAMFITCDILRTGNDGEEEQTLPESSGAAKPGTNNH